VLKSRRNSWLLQIYSVTTQKKFLALSDIQGVTTQKKLLALSNI
jgi:hypothetical protein